MALGGALAIGRTGLQAAQVGIEVAGHNLANIATRGYHRQEALLAPNRSQEIQNGIFVGRGVQVIDVIRRADEALEARLRSGIADQERSLTQKNLLEQIESIQNEFSEIGVSSQLGEFFNVWSQLANNPQDNSLRSTVVQQSKSLAAHLRTLRSDLISVRTQTDNAIDGAVAAANSLLDKIQQVNQAIAAAEGGGTGTASGLRDERGVLLNELSKYLDVSTVENYSGAVNVYVGSTPVILDGRNLGIETRKTTIGNELQIEVVLATDGTVLDTSSGQIGALVASREADVVNAVDVLDDFASSLIFEVNRIHSQGQGVKGFTTFTSDQRVLDTAVALNDPDAGLDFTPEHGSFRISVTQKSTGQRVTTTIDVDLDGIGGNDTTLADLQASIDAIVGIGATITSDGRLQIDSDAADFEFTFSDDTSGTLAALGINGFFTGTSADDIDVSEVIDNDLGLLAVAQEHLPGDNRNALAIAGLRDTRLDSLGGLTISEKWSRHIEEYAVRLGQAGQQFKADTIVRENLEAQQQQISGVNADEEAINLMSYQRAYQGSARFISVVDEMLQTLLGLI